MDAEPQIFLSYRRGDASAHAGRLYDALVGVLGKSRVFFDIGKSTADELAEVIHEALGRAEVVIAVIRPAWLVAADEHGGRRLDDPEDFVRQELNIRTRRSRADRPRAGQQRGDARKGHLAERSRA